MIIKTEKGGRPNIDEIIMIKIFNLAGMHGLSDPELERQITDRISFRKFLGFPASIPDYSTVWIFRERLSKTGRDKKIWQELQRQLDAKGLEGKEGSNSGCNFHNLRPGHAKADKPRGTEAKNKKK